MPKIVIFSLIGLMLSVFLSSPSFSDEAKKPAKLDKSKSIVLYDDGTWEYKDIPITIQKHPPEGVNVPIPSCPEWCEVSYRYCPDPLPDGKCKLSKRGRVYG